MMRQATIAALVAFGLVVLALTMLRASSDERAPDRSSPGDAGPPKIQRLPTRSAKDALLAPAQVPSALPGPQDGGG